MRVLKRCSEEGCRNFAFTKGLCSKHYNRKWRKENPDKVEKYKGRYTYSRKYKETPQRRISRNLRRRLREVLKKNRKSTRLIDLVGCSTLELKEHLEKMFDENMSWNNYGQWHIDHIKPCASFDLSDLQQQRECFHYTNLQPLWAKDNLSKHCKEIV